MAVRDLRLLARIVEINEPGEQEYRPKHGEAAALRRLMQRGLLMCAGDAYLPTKLGVKVIYGFVAFLGAC